MLDTEANADRNQHYGERMGSTTGKGQGSVNRHEPVRLTHDDD